jgi:lactate 2-monooxygenase
MPSDQAPSSSTGVQRQLEIYLAGREGRTPPLPVAFEKLESRAREALSPEAFDYVAGGAGGEDTMRANREAFRRWRLVPRVLRDVARRDLAVAVLGQRLIAPVLLAPVGVLSIIHPDAERAVARAAAATGIPFVLSTASSTPLETVAAEAGAAPRWFQLYWPADPELAASFIARAEAAGFQALVVTLDTHVLGWRERDIARAYLPFLYGEGLANYMSDPVFRGALQRPPEEDPRAAALHFARVFASSSLTWEDIAALRDRTRLPILLKGILHPDDARRAADHGVAGVIVSNHGGRQVDGAIAALDALPEVADAVGDRLAVLFDSGIRRGADVLQALALGARAVLLGRPYVYGLALGGEDGVRHVVLNLLAELDVTLALLGCASVSEIGGDCVVGRA